MHPTLRVQGALGLHALMSLLVRPSRSKTTKEPFSFHESSTPEWSGDDHGHDDDLDRASNFNVAYVPGHDPDISICELSLTRDVAVHPRIFKDSFGLGFEPFM